MFQVLPTNLQRLLITDDGFFLATIFNGCALKKRSQSHVSPDTSQWQIPQLPAGSEDHYEENLAEPDQEEEQVDYNQTINLDDSEFGKY